MSTSKAKKATLKTAVIDTLLASGGELPPAPQPRITRPGHLIQYRGNYYHLPKPWQQLRVVVFDDDPKVRLAELTKQCQDSLTDKQVRDNLYLMSYQKVTAAHRRKIQPFDVIPCNVEY